MNHKENQEKAELSIYEQSLKVAKEKPFAATTFVQLAYDITKGSLKHKNGDIEPQDVLKAIREMNPSEKGVRTENWRKRWLTDSV